MVFLYTPLSVFSGYSCSNLLVYLKLNEIVLNGNAVVSESLEDLKTK